jgi:hypothetical protein
MPVQQIWYWAGGAEAENGDTQSFFADVALGAPQTVYAFTAMQGVLFNVPKFAPEAGDLYLAYSQIYSYKTSSGVNNVYLSPNGPTSAIFADEVEEVTFAWEAVSPTSGVGIASNFTLQIFGWGTTTMEKKSRLETVAEKVCVLYDSTGRIVLTNFVVTLSGGRTATDAEVEARARQRAEGLGHDPASLSALHVAAKDCADSAVYRVDVATKKLLKLRESSIAMKRASRSLRAGPTAFGTKLP